MLSDEFMSLFSRVRLLTYRRLFKKVREKDGSLSATEAYTVDVIYLLGNPTITQLAETLGISQPNATYKVNSLVSKGYVKRMGSENDKRECRISLSDRFFLYFDSQTFRFVNKGAERLEQEYSPEEIELFTRMLRTLGSHLQDEE